MFNIGNESTIQGVFWDRLKMTIVGVIGAVLITLVIAIWKGMTAFGAGNVSVASNYASFASGISTVGLTILTAWYAYLTRNLVENARKERQLREQERIEDWYEDVVSPARLLLERWEREFAMPNGLTDEGTAYISLEQRDSFCEDFHGLCVQLREQTSRHPSGVSDDVVNKAREVSRTWTVIRHPDLGLEHKLEKDHSLRTNIEELINQIEENSERFERTLKKRESD